MVNHLSNSELNKWLNSAFCVYYLLTIIAMIIRPILLLNPIPGFYNNIVYGYPQLTRVNTVYAHPARAGVAEPTASGQNKVRRCVNLKSSRSRIVVSSGPRSAGLASLFQAPGT